MPPQASQSSAALPPGYTLDSPPSGAAAPATTAALPPGYTLDSTPDPNAGAPTTGLASVPGKLWRAIKPIADVTAPAIGYQMYRKLTHQPNELASVPEKATLAFAGMEAPEFEEGAQPIAEAQAQNARQRGASLASRAPAGDASVLDHPAVSPWVDAAKKEVMKVPGANLAKTAYDSLHGLFFGDGEAPAAPTPSVPAEWGKGTYGTPVDQWGKRVPAVTPPPGAAALADVPTPATQPAAQTGEALASIPTSPWRMKPQAAALADAAPASKAAVSQQLDDTLRTAVGNQPLKPGVPIRYQFKSTPPAASVPAEGSDATVPEGHTPVEGSSAVKSFMYDPDAQEMHIAPTKGYTHVYGDVSPDQAQAFQDAESKGRAWGTLRNSPGVTHVAKIMENGTRVAIKPTDVGEDLTGQLQDSVAAVNKAKWRTKKVQ